jgi:hypothetical protein
MVLYLSHRQKPVSTYDFGLASRMDHGLRRDDDKQTDTLLSKGVPCSYLMGLLQF